MTINFENNLNIETLVGNRALDAILRVDLAGEWGAKRIYEGQLWGLKVRGEGGSAVDLIKDMYSQECDHVKHFEYLAKIYHVRPSLLAPLWHWGAWALGAATALGGVHRAMACTVAVEDVIEDHYQKQIAYLGEEHPVTADLKKFRQEEGEHKIIAEDFIKNDRKSFSILSHAIRGMTCLVIHLSEIF